MLSAKELRRECREAAPWLGLAWHMTCNALVREKGSIRYDAKPGLNTLIRVDYQGAEEVPTGTCHAILKAAFAAFGAVAFEPSEHSRLTRAHPDSKLGDGEPVLHRAPDHGGARPQLESFGGPRQVIEFVALHWCP